MKLNHNIYMYEDITISYPCITLLLTPVVGYCGSSGVPVGLIIRSGLLPRTPF